MKASYVLNQPKENNLYQLYQDIARISKAQYVNDETSGFSFVKHEGSEWPNCSFISQRPYDYHFQALIDNIKKNVFPRLFIFNEDDLLNPLLNEFLSANRFLGAGKWLNMVLDAESWNLEPANGNECREIKEYDEVCEWAESASLFLFKGKKLDRDIFFNGIEKGLLRLFAYVFEGKIIAITLVYFVLPVPGIYMVATHPEFRKRGFGFDIMNYSLQNIMSSEVKQVTLQSTLDGLPLYKKMGFVTNAELSLYYCMAK